MPWYRYETGATLNALPVCYCKNDTPCQPCLDTARDEQNSPDLRAAQESFRDASADFYIPGWTPEDEDNRAHDRKILDDMAAEAFENPDMARALLTLYHDDAFTPADLDAMRKADAKGLHSITDDEVAGWFSK